MKQTLTKILLVVLALTCVLALASCDKKKDKKTTTTTAGEGPVAPAATVEYVAYVVKQSSPTKAVTNSTYTVGGDTLTGTSTLQVANSSSGKVAKFAYSYQKFNQLGAEERISTVSGVEFSRNNTVAVFTETGTEWSSYQATVSLGNFAVTTGTVVAEGNGYKLTASIPAASSASVFGATIKASGNVTLVLTVADGQLTAASISYTTEAGAAVVVNCVYTYYQESFTVSAQ